MGSCLERELKQIPVRLQPTDVITSAREFVIALLLGLALSPARLTSAKQGGPQRGDTLSLIQAAA
jgi:hypothetical protein